MRHFFYYLIVLNLIFCFYVKQVSIFIINAGDHIWILPLSISINQTPQRGTQTEGEIQLNAGLLPFTILSPSENLFMGSNPSVREERNMI